MSDKIIDRNRIDLKETQIKMIRSGWGDGAVDDAEVEKIDYISDGLKVKGYLAYPSEDGKYPCIIWCRGGIGNAGIIDAFNAKGIFGQLASWGYVVFAPQYRGNDGGEGEDEFGGNDVNDIINLIPLADEIPQADNSLWGIEGWSRGGMMTYLVLSRTDIFKAAVVTGGIANLRCSSDESRFMRRLFEMSLGKYNSEEFNQNCNSRSIVNFADRLSRTSPILIMHGTADNRVFPHDSIDLSYKLIEYDIPFRLILLEKGDHFLKKHRKEVDVNRKMWFDKFLKN
jgi:dipeptidyl aminopeptidase/acylaminoacyl peptidase